MEYTNTFEFRYHLYSANVITELNGKPQRERCSNDLNWIIQGLKEAAQKLRNGKSYIIDFKENKVVAEYQHWDS